MGVTYADQVETLRQQFYQENPEHPMLNYIDTMKFGDVPDSEIVKRLSEDYRKGAAEGGKNWVLNKGPETVELVAQAGNLGFTLLKNDPFTIGMAFADGSYKDIIPDHNIRSGKISEAIAPYYQKPSEEFTNNSVYMEAYGNHQQFLTAAEIGLDVAGLAFGVGAASFADDGAKYLAKYGNKAVENAGDIYKASLAARIDGDVLAKQILKNSKKDKNFILSAVEKVKTKIDVAWTKKFFDDKKMLKLQDKLGVEVSQSNFFTPYGDEFTSINFGEDAISGSFSYAETTTRVRHTHPINPTASRTDYNSLLKARRNGADNLTELEIISPNGNKTWTLEMLRDLFGY
jgi:hypothetical protein